MKKQLLSLSVITCLALSSIPTVMAQQGSGNHNGNCNKRGNDMMRVLKQLDLSAQQKLDIKSLMKQAREDHSVYGSEKQEIRTQMRELMKMPSWDAQTARQLITLQIEQARDIQLNRAQAKHSIYKLLTNEQQTQLADIADKPKQNKRKQKRQKRKARMHDRLVKKLDLSEGQHAQWKALHEDRKALKEGFKPIMKAHKEKVKALVHSDEFDAKAWLALQESFSSELIEHRLLLAEAQYNSRAILTLEQQENFEKIKSKMVKTRW